MLRWYGRMRVVDEGRRGALTGEGTGRQSENQLAGYLGTVQYDGVQL